MTAEISVRITNPTGLHARPAVRLAQLAAGFESTVQVRLADQPNWVRASSTAQVMKLKARHNATLQFRAEGNDAEAAVATLVAFVRRNFDESAAAHGAPASRAGSAASAAEADISASTSGGEELTFVGEVAAEGLVQGVIWIGPENAARPRVARLLDGEHRALESALGAAAARLAALREGADAMGGEIIGFQVEMLADREFIAPAFTAIAAGSPAHEAWSRLMDAEVADYAGSEDEYFRARVDDLRDLRDRVLDALVGGNGDPLAAAPAGAILVIEDLTPSRFLEIDWKRVGGVAVRGGSPTSHVAMLARARGVPMLIRLQASAADVPVGADAVLDAERGRLCVRPGPAALERFRERAANRSALIRDVTRYLGRAALTADGAPVKVYINVDDARELTDVNPRHCDGIGLARTEFLFQGRAAMPDEDAQYMAYRRLLEWADGRPVTIRTLDAGGDKPIPGLTHDDESNPFLGVRGVRLSLERPDVFAVQLRALSRAAVHGVLKVMLPIVTVPRELETVRGLLERQVHDLCAAGVAAKMPPLGMMVEVPAAALNIAAFGADFLSIGSNDLIQYTLAVGRDCPGVCDLRDPLNPAVLELIRRVATHGTERGIEVSLCGEMAADPRCIGALLAAGLRVLSVPPAVLARVKAALASSGIAPTA